MTELLARREIKHCLIQVPKYDMSFSNHRLPFLSFTLLPGRMYLASNKTAGFPGSSESIDYCLPARYREMESPRCSSSLVREWLCIGTVVQSKLD
jgi:hypothetical protein